MFVKSQIHLVSTRYALKALQGLKRAAQLTEEALPPSIKYPGKKNNRHRWKITEKLTEVAGAHGLESIGNFETYSKKPFKPLKEQLYSLKAKGEAAAEDDDQAIGIGEALVKHSERVQQEYEKKRLEPGFQERERQKKETMDDLDEDISLEELQKEYHSLTEHDFKGKYRFERRMNRYLTQLRKKIEETTLELEMPLSKYQKKENLIEIYDEQVRRGKIDPSFLEEFMRRGTPEELEVINGEKLEDEEITSKSTTVNPQQEQQLMTTEEFQQMSDDSLEMYDPSKREPLYIEIESKYENLKPLIELLRPLDARRYDLMKRHKPLAHWMQEQASLEQARISFDEITKIFEALQGNVEEFQKMVEPGSFGPFLLFVRERIVNRFDDRKKWLEEGMTGFRAVPDSEIQEKHKQWEDEDQNKNRENFLMLFLETEMTSYRDLSIRFRNYKLEFLKTKKMVEGQLTSEAEQKWKTRQEFTEKSTEWLKKIFKFEKDLKSKDSKEQQQQQETAEAGDQDEDDTLPHEEMELITKDRVLEAMELMDMVGMPYTLTPRKNQMDKSGLKAELKSHVMYHSTKDKHPKEKRVTLTMKISQCNFSLKAYERFRSIVGKRYCLQNDTLTLKCDYFQEKESNEKYVMKLAREIVEEAKKADSGADFGAEIMEKKKIPDQMELIKLRMKNFEEEERRATRYFQVWKSGLREGKQGLGADFTRGFAAHWQFSEGQTFPTEKSKYGGYQELVTSSSSVDIGSLATEMENDEKGMFNS